MIANPANILQNTAHLKFNPTGLDKQYKVQHYSNGQLLIQYNVAVKFIRQEKKHYILQLNRTDVESGGNQTMHLSWQSNADKYCIRWNVLLVNTPKSPPYIIIKRSSADG